MLCHIIVSRAIVETDISEKITYVGYTVCTGKSGHGCEFCGESNEG